jgi:hypothetical protein
MEPPTARVCPPHHWYIVGADTAQRWTCHRCGALRANQDTSDEAINLSWRSARRARTAGRPARPALAHGAPAESLAHSGA